MINKMRKHIVSELAIEHTKEIVNREGWSDKASFKKLDFKKRLEGKVFVEYMGEKVKRFKKKERETVLGVLNQDVSSTPQSTQLTKYQQFSALLRSSSKSLCCDPLLCII